LLNNLSKAAICFHTMADTVESVLRRGQVKCVYVCVCVVWVAAAAAEPCS
jgi:hypothetical protein